LFEGSWYSPALSSNKENERVIYIHAMQSSVGVEVYLLFFLTPALGEGKWSGSLSGIIYRQGKCRRNPLNRRCGGIDSQSGRFGEEINILLPPRFESQPLQLHDIELGCLHPVGYM